ncbi:MAG TPA: hypothetical protein VLE97_06385 [Gaiellaceae bacterium]|nr:hypothetical protein [Gaiellaceae bacterium]
MSRQRIRFAFEHITCEAVVDVYLPRPDPITEGAETMAARVCPACPICALPMKYAGFSFEVDDLATLNRPFP